MHEKLEHLEKETLVELINTMLSDLKEENMTTQYNHYKDLIEEKLYCIDVDEARTIVRNMQPYHEVFNTETVRNMMHNNNVAYDKKLCIKYYLAMNMYANDARQVADDNNIPLDKFCFVMAKSFINDVDAGKYKVEKYFTEIAIM